MRFFFLMLVFAFYSSFAFTQFEDDFKIPDRMTVVEPAFKGVNETVGIDEFLKEKLDYPTNAAKAGAEGTVVVQFEVRPDGTLSDVLVVNSVCPEYDDAVIKAVKASSGMWTPGTKNGQAVTMEKEMAVVFKSEGSEMYKTAQLYAVRANKLLKEGKYKKSIKLYNKAIVLCPDCAFTFYHRGLARYNCGDQKGAILDLQRTADLGSHQADSLLTVLHYEVIFAKESTK